MICRALGSIDSLTASPQKDEEASFAPILKKEDGQIDWRLSARAIDRRIRGFQPFPTSYSYCDGVRYTFWSTEPIGSIEAVTPGTIIEAAAGKLLIACGPNSAILVNEIQPEGKRRMPVRDFINGAKIRRGDVFIGR
jgi:methionyl-tRNA formyltransferase